MLSFVTNDNVVIKYSDTGNGKPWKWEMDPLILVCSRICVSLYTAEFMFRPYTLSLDTDINSSVDSGETSGFNEQRSVHFGYKVLYSKYLFL